MTPPPQDPDWKVAEKDPVDNTIYYKHPDTKGLYFIGTNGMVKA